MSDLTINRPIEGDVNINTTASVPQVGPEEFLAAIDSLLAVPGVKKIRWHQYTPYFNDGEPCEFGVNEPAVKLSKKIFGDTSEQSDYDDGFVDSYGLYEYNGGNGYSEDNKTYEINGVSTKAVYDALQGANWDSFEAVAKANFGDHAVVTATTEGFEVEFFEHD